MGSKKIVDDIIFKCQLMIISNSYKCLNMYLFTEATKIVIRESMLEK